MGPDAQCMYTEASVQFMYQVSLCIGIILFLGLVSVFVASFRMVLDETIVTDMIGFLHHRFILALTATMSQLICI